ncbi:CD1375 family protein [Caldanaerobius polysaccharolyticus]|nr:CD1375 family protein [Caldanaerobius polysaccharolyticus]
MSYWVNIYYTLIINGRKTVNDVPASIKQDVINMLIQNGYTINADGTVTK